MKVTPRFDLILCKHCGAIAALIPRPAIVGRFSLTCQECSTTFAVYPEQPSKPSIDKTLVISYTDSVPA